MSEADRLPTFPEWRRDLEDAVSEQQDTIQAQAAEIARLQRELARLQRGEFTPDELQNICHNLSESNEAAFSQGCIDYQTKLFGRCLLRQRAEAAEADMERFRNQGIADHLRAEAAEKQAKSCNEVMMNCSNEADRHIERIGRLCGVRFTDNHSEADIERKVCERLTAIEAAEKRAADNQRAADVVQQIEQHWLEVKQHSRGGWSIRGGNGGHTRAKSLIEGIELHCCDKSKAKTIALAPPAPAETPEGKESPTTLYNCRFYGPVQPPETPEGKETK